ncbi:MAG: type II toxin-antitoxin system VapC family toxin [Spirochaetales bacterium]|nr:type II toxin-antitoxin system VapC family toxin [Spirochaetales bacterium]
MNRYLLDTNALIAFFQGNHRISRMIQQATWIGVSIISVIEFLSYEKLTDQNKQIFHEFIAGIDCLNVEASNQPMIQECIRLRQQYGLKLPDALIAALAITTGADLVTADAKFNRLSPGLRIQNFQVGGQP